MIKRSSSAVGESSSGARKRQASVPPSMLPINLIALLILPFVEDRSTWNSVCCANKELRETGKRMRPPWPNATLNVGGTAVIAVAFSPCKSFLACSIARQTVVHVWDRYGQQTRLEGHTGGVLCLQYSLDGRCLASGSSDKTIRLWHVTSEAAAAAHSSSSDESRTRGSDIILLGL
jgi:WD40 repeat protein